MMKSWIFYAFFITQVVLGQSFKPNELSLNEFLGYVKKYHPLVKSSQLELTKAQANLMMARGAFDPKIEVDFDKKQFKEKEYYSVFNSSFKIPTWYGIELKAGFDTNGGYYINPESALPSQGLQNIGIQIPLGQGIWINQRMADIRKAKMQLSLSKSEQRIIAIGVLYDACIAYFNWKRNHDEVRLYSQYAENAQNRFQAVKGLIEQGDKPAIDSVEAHINVKNRLLSLEDSQLKLAKARLELSNHLWLENNVPMELKETMLPEDNLFNSISETLKTDTGLTAEFDVEQHPKINMLNQKLSMLGVDRQLKRNQLLPKIDFGYSYLFVPNSNLNNYDKDYKLGLNFYFPLFLRKERGSIKLAQAKIKEAEFGITMEKLQLTNKVNALQTEVKSLTKQKVLALSLVKDTQTLLDAEERLFAIGESSMFLINTRENSLVGMQLSNILIENRLFSAHAELFKNRVLD